MTPVKFRPLRCLDLEERPIEQNSFFRSYSVLDCHWCVVLHLRTRSLRLRMIWLPMRLKKKYLMLIANGAGVGPQSLGQACGPPTHFGDGSSKSSFHSNHRSFSCSSSSLLTADAATSTDARLRGRTGPTRLGVAPARPPFVQPKWQIVAIRSYRGAGGR
jgi:hypothetical protein